MNGNESARRHHNAWWQILLLFVLLLPVILLLTVPSIRTSNELMVILTLVLIANLVLLWLATRKRRAVSAVAVPPVIPRELGPEEIPQTIQEILDVRQAVLEDDVMIFRGPLRQKSEAAFERLKHEYAGQKTPLLQQDPVYGSSVFLLPEVVPVAVDRPVRPLVHWGLFALTLLTTTAAGAAQRGVDIIHDPRGFIYGLPYSLALMAILGFHELGHYFTARHYKIRVTPPFFIPVPFALGTFGAFIQMRSAPQDRRSLFDVAVAGPLAGLVLAIPAVIIGLKHSTIVPVGYPGQDIGLGFISSSILFMSLAKWTLGAAVLQNDILISPLAFAGALGLLVTALNLLPIGQLDGGHMARSMFGTRVGGWISQVIMFGLFIAALYKPQYLLWALIVFFIARRVSPPMNDVTPITGWRMLLGALAFVILILILFPMPEALWNAMNPTPQPETLTI